MEDKKIKDDNQLAELLQVEYWERWLKGCQGEEERKEVTKAKALFTKAYGTGPEAPAANLFAAFSAGMAAGMEIAALMDQVAMKKKKEAGEHGNNASQAF